MFRTELGHKYILVECSVIALCLPVMSKLPVINSCAINRTMIGMSIKRISVLNLCHVSKPFVKSTPGHEFCHGQMMHKARKRGLSILLTAHCLEKIHIFMKFRHHIPYVSDFVPYKQRFAKGPTSQQLKIKSYRFCLFHIILIRYVFPGSCY